MRNSKMMQMLIGMALMSESFEMNSQGEVGTSRSKPKKETSKPIPFNKQEGVAQMILDYKLIKSGESKKGKRKQAIIVSKIDNWIAKGFLNEDDLK